MSASFIDSHCHLNFEDFQTDLETVLEEAKRQNIHKMLTICTKVDEIDTLVTLIEKYPQIYATIGVHPHEAAATLAQYDKAHLKIWIHSYVNHPKIIGIGEVGLDFYYNHSSRDAQFDLFQTHIEAALEAKLPLSIHTREAEVDTIALLKQYPKAKGVIHCFSGHQYLADEALALGFYISISGIATFKKSDELRSIIQTIPLDRLLLETDAPYLAPLPHRGRRNEPAMIIHTAQEVAKLKEISVEDLANQTTKNFYTLFTKAIS
ncbi:MAG: TatD family hydrolase [Janthinobacterium lividum]